MCRLELLTNLFNCDKIDGFEDSFYSDQELIERTKVRTCLGWSPEVEYTKISFEVAERIFFINKIMVLHDE